jgi:hypothetical protein
VLKFDVNLSTNLSSSYFLLPVDLINSIILFETGFTHAMFKALDALERIAEERADDDKIKK